MHPRIVGSILLPLHERLKRASTFADLRRLEQSQWLDIDILRQLQLDRLRAHVTLAYQHTAYYRRLMDEHGLPPQRIQTFADFARLPPLTRETLRRNFDDLCTKGIPLKRVQHIATGGSTGEPVTVRTDAGIAFGPAARYRAHRWFGLNPGAREIVLWGAPIELGKQDFVRTLRDTLLNSRLLSAFDLGEAALARYQRVLTRFRPEKIYGYSSAVSLFASYLRTIGWRPDWQIKAVFVTAEPLFPFQRSAIEAAFHCPVALEYGARDAGLLANECPKGGLHIPAEGILLETTGTVGDTGSGEVLVTNFFTPAMPILRYRTGDIGALDPSSCACGRSLPLLQSVDGRRTDFLLTPDGRVLHALSAIYVLREIPEVRAFQVVQDTIDTIVVRIVPEPTFGEAQRQTVRRRLGTLFGAGVDISIEEVETLEQGRSGKFRYVVSRVADPFLEQVLGSTGSADRSADVVRSTRSEP